MTNLTKRERQIVEWLRGVAESVEQEQKLYKPWTSQWLSCRDQIESAQEFADAIEAGEPWRGEGDA